MCQFPQIKNGSRGNDFPENKPATLGRLDTSHPHSCLWLQPIAGLHAARGVLYLPQSSEHMGLSTADSNRGGGKRGSKTTGSALFSCGGWENFKCQVNTFKMCMGKKKKKARGDFPRKAGNPP